MGRFPAVLGVPVVGHRQPSRVRLVAELRVIVEQAEQRVGDASSRVPPARASKNRNDPFWFVVAGACAKLSWMRSFIPDRSMLMPALTVWLPVTFVTLSVQRNTKSFQDPG